MRERYRISYDRRLDFIIAAKTKSRNRYRLRNI